MDGPGGGRLARFVFKELGGGGIYIDNELFYFVLLSIIFIWDTHRMQFSTVLYSC